MFEPTEPALVDTPQVADMMRSLENCRLLANLEIRKAQKRHDKSAEESWNHVLRFCTEAGCHGSILRAIG